jgi:hypothetical protein
MKSVSGPSSGGHDDIRMRLQRVIDFWNAFSVSGDSGQTTPGALEEIQAEVSDCLARGPVDVARIERLTAKAAMLMSGQNLF